MCGLAFFTGKKAPDFNKLTILGIYNDSRGGDSCGISYNNKVWRGTTKGQKYFSDYIQNFTERDLSDVRTLLIHTRKATSGLNPANAHPFSFRTSSKGKIVVNDDKYDPEFIGMHNGTIQNLNSLKKDFDLGPWADMDSKAMLGCIYKYNDYEILKEYEGAAVLVWYQGDDLFVFKGGDYQDKTEERSLYYVKEKEGLYFSSLAESLKAISTNEVIQVPVNYVYKYNKGSLVDQVRIDKPEPILPPMQILANRENTLFSNEYDHVTPMPGIVYQKDLRYFVNGSKLHGEYFINFKTGTIEKAKYNNQNVEEFFFLDGILINNRTNYIKWKVKFEKVLRGEDQKIDFADFSECFTVPFYITDSIEQEFLYENNADGSVLLDGKLHSDTVLYPITGKYVEITVGKVISEENALEEFKYDLKSHLSLLRNTLNVQPHIIEELDEDDLQFINDLTTSLNGSEIF